MKGKLGTSTKEILKLFGEITDKLCGEDCEKWLEALRLFSKGEPVWTEGMIHIPLEWSPDIGEVDYALIQDHIKLQDEGFPRGWRLPTERELLLDLGKKKFMSVLGEYFWSSTKCPDNYGYKIVGISSVGNTLERSSSKSFYSTNQKNPHLRLCRPITIPG